MTESVPLRPPEPLLEVSGLSVGYDRAPILGPVSFSVARGRAVAIYGGNGSGKTTLLKTLVGVLPRISGGVFLEGSDVSDLRSSDRVRHGIAFVMQGGAVFPSLTVKENLLVGRLAVRKRGHYHRRDGLVAEWFPELKGKEEQAGATLSGGERQLLALARGLIQRPKLLMLDEPSLGLSGSAMGRVQEVLVDQMSTERIGVLFSEQSRFLADALGAVIHHTDEWVSEDA